MVSNVVVATSRVGASDGGPSQTSALRRGILPLLQDDGSAVATVDQPAEGSSDGRGFATRQVSYASYLELWTLLIDPSRGKVSSQRSSPPLDSAAYSSRELVYTMTHMSSSVRCSSWSTTSSLGLSCSSLISLFSVPSQLLMMTLTSSTSR